MSEWSRRLASGPSGTIDLGTEEGRAFLQERLAFFGGVGFNPRRTLRIGITCVAPPMPRAASALRCPRSP
jgi:hypothetical protein